MLVRRIMAREVFPTFQRGVEVPSCCERVILRYEKGTKIRKLGTPGPLFAVFPALLPLFAALIHATI